MQQGVGQRPLWHLGNRDFAREPDPARPTVSRNLSSSQLIAGKVERIPVTWLTRNRRAGVRARLHLSLDTIVSVLCLYVHHGLSLVAWPVPPRCHLRYVPCADRL